MNRRFCSTPPLKQLLKLILKDRDSIPYPNIDRRFHWQHGGVTLLLCSRRANIIPLSDLPNLLKINVSPPISLDNPFDNPPGCVVYQFRWPLPFNGVPGKISEAVRKNFVTIL